MTEVRVDSGFLNNLAGRIDRVSADLSHQSQLGDIGVREAPAVGRALSDLDERWNVRRDDFSQLLDSLAKGLRLTASNFDEADRALATKLHDSGPGGAR